MFWILAYDQALWGTLAAGWEKEGELATTLWNLNPHPILLWLPVDWALRFLLISVNRKRVWMWTNIEKHVPRVMTPLLMTSLPISISHRLFRCRYSNSRDVYSCKLSFLFLPHHQSTPESLLTGYLESFDATESMYDIKGSKCKNEACMKVTQLCVTKKMATFLIVVLIYTQDMQ